MNGIPTSSLAQFQIVFGTLAGVVAKEIGFDIDPAPPSGPVLQLPEVPQELAPRCEPGRLMTGYPDIIADSYRPAIPKDPTRAHGKLMKAIELERRLPSGPPRGYLEKLKFRRVAGLYEKSIAALGGADPYNAAIARARLGIFEAMKLGDWRGLHSRLSLAASAFAAAGHHEMASRCMRAAGFEADSYGLLEKAAEYAESAIGGGADNLTARIRALDAWIGCIEMAASADERSFYYPRYERREDYIRRMVERALKITDGIDCSENLLAAAWICEDLARLAGIVYQGLYKREGAEFAAKIFSKASPIAETSGDKGAAARFARQAGHMFAMRSNQGWKEERYREDLRYKAASAEMKRAAGLSSDDKLAVAMDLEAAGWFAFAHAERAVIFQREKELSYLDAALCSLRAADARHSVGDDEKAI